MRTTWRRWLAIWALALVFGLPLAACSAKKSTAKAVPAGSTVLALGDSLTYGTGASPDTAYPVVLAQLTGWNVINAGVAGDTSAQALERLPALLQEHQPQLVIVSIGGNDFLRKWPEGDTRANIAAICQQAQASGAQVLLVAVPRLSLAAALGQMTDHTLYADIAKELKLPLQREGWSEVLADESLRSDAVHANAKGYAQFARSVQGTAFAVGLLQK
ncbi:MAG: GDSL-type esterase/lipase family protein [Brachymonas sp.]|nr:GDSL-type esterase/lipase family protein [Brachymonas sp.]